MNENSFQMTRLGVLSRAGWGLILTATLAGCSSDSNGDSKDSDDDGGVAGSGNDATGGRAAVGGGHSASGGDEGLGGDGSGGASGGANSTGGTGSGGETNMGGSDPGGIVGDCPSGTFDDDADPRTHCVAQSSCAPGEFVVAEGTPSLDRECEVCAEGEFSSTVNAESCSLWKECTWALGGIAQSGTSSEDTVCGPASDYRQFGTTEVDGIQDIAVSVDGSVYVAGVTRGPLVSPTLFADAFLRKYDSNGNVVWTRQFLPGQALDLAVDAEGDVYVVGQKINWGIPVTTSGFIQKFDPEGTTLWSHDLGIGIIGNNDSIEIDAHGDVYVSGSVDGDLAGVVGLQDIFLRKYESDGAASWTKQFGTTGWDVPLGLDSDGSGDVYVGYSSSGSAHLVKYDADGEVVWTETVANSTFVIQEVVGDGADAIYVVGDTTVAMEGPVGGIRDGVVRKYGTTGAVEWTRQFGSPDADNVKSAAVSADGRLIIAGDIYSKRFGADELNSPFLRVYTASGVVQSTRYFGTGSSDVCEGVAVTSDAIYVAGPTLGAFVGTNQGSADAWLARFPFAAP